MTDHIARVREQAEREAYAHIGGFGARTWFVEGAVWLASRLTREKLVAYLRTQNVFRGGMNEAVAEEQADVILALLTDDPGGV